MLFMLADAASMGDRRAFAFAPEK